MWGLWHYLLPLKNPSLCHRVRAKLFMETDGQKDEKIGSLTLSRFFQGVTSVGAKTSARPFHQEWLCIFCQSHFCAAADILMIHTLPGTLFIYGCSVPLRGIKNGT